MYNIKISCNLFLKLCALVHFMKRKCKNARYIRKGHLVFLSLEFSSGTIAFRDFTVSRENRLLKCYFRSFGGTKISKFSRPYWGGFQCRPTPLQSCFTTRYACQLATLASSLHSFYIFKVKDFNPKSFLFHLNMKIRKL